MLFMHVFAEDLVVPRWQHKATVGDAAETHGLNMASQFSEKFYLVSIEQEAGGRAMLHMWKLHLCSVQALSGNIPQSPHEGQPRVIGSLPPSASSVNLQTASRLTLTSNLLISTELSLPPTISVLHATPAAGHMSSSTIYPACLAPYLFATTCSDNSVRFWRCVAFQSECSTQVTAYQWEEWPLFAEGSLSSSVSLSGWPVALCCSYPGCFAVACRHAEYDGHGADGDLSVSVFECESSGGSTWALEDTLLLGDLHKGLAPGLTVDHDLLVHSRTQGSSSNDPSMAKHLLHLDWVSKEDGSHMLTVGIGSRVIIYGRLPGPATVTLSPRQEANRKGSHPYPSFPGWHSEGSQSSRPRWVPLRCVGLVSAFDGAPGLPVALSWLRDGVLVVGMDCEMHVYVQWRQSSNMDAESALSDSQPITQEFDQLASSARLPHAVTLSRRAAAVDSRPKPSRQNLTQAARSCARFGVMATTAPHILGAIPTASTNDCGLFESAEVLAPTLPHYHPTQLLGLLDLGEEQRVRAVLARLLRSIAGDVACLPDEETEEGAGRGIRHTRSGSSASAPWEIGPSGLREYPTDYVEIEAVPPLPLYSLLAVHGLETPSSHSLLNQNPVSDSLSGLRSTQHSDKDQYEELLHVTDSAADDDDFMIEQQNSPPKTVDLRAFSPTYFGKEQADLLAAHLVHASLPGLTRLEQMYLLGLADRLGRIDAESSSRSLGIDSCGVRFLLAVRLRSFLLTTLPPAPRSQLLLHGLATCHFAWAFHSESQEELLEQATSERQEQYRWPELRALGIGWWLRNNTMLRTCIEKMAKVMFQDNGNPLDAALFYLAMKKKAVLWGLFRSKGELKMTEFFRNDFSEERWRRAALKNAFALLGKQRFEQAAAFFLLAGSLKDAVEVCVERLEDLQLALVICRLYEADPDAGSSLYRTTLALYVLRKCERCDVKAQKHNDPFLRSLAFWIVGDYSGALATLLDQPDYKSDRGSGTAYLSSSCNPAIFSFYSFLRSHPLIQRQRLAAGQQQSKGISLRERNLYFSTAHTYFKAGCPLLVLEVLTRMPPIAVTYGAADETKHQTKEKTEFLDRRPDRDSSRSLDMANAIDWGTNSAQSDSDSLELSWGSENSDDDEGLTMKNLDQAKDAVTKREPDANLGKAKSILLPGQILQTDIMAEQLKFRACLKLLVTELRTLAMGYEVGYPLFV
uniref:RAVE complex protein Rav1 C-terminal domain-containing protein n=1 Tax=Eptatretus burgeri TaxID=7764 RepID=A0A8C4N7A1_EPTBU